MSVSMKRLSFAVIVLLAVVGGVAYYQNRDVAAEGPAFATAEATRGSVVKTVEATGTLQAVTTVQVGSQVSGTIARLHADFNSNVRAGQVVAELDPSLFETQVEQAEATLQRLEADLERAKVQAEDAQIKLRRARELFERELVAANELETAESNARVAAASVKGAEAQLVQSQASLNQVRVNLSHTVIRSPIDGVVIARNVDVGQTVAASMQAPVLYEIARDLREMQVNANIDESDIGGIAPGQPVTFRVDAYPDDTFTGTVAQVRLQPVVQQNVVSYVTVIDVPNPDLRLKPGMTAAVTIETARADDVLRVPNAALRFRPTEEVFTALGMDPAGANPGGAAPATAAAQAEDAAGVARGGGAGASMSEGERAALRERLQRMSPEERAQVIAARGGGAGARAGGAAAGAGRQPRPAGGENGGRGVVWVYDQGRLARVPVRLGLSDATQTALIGGDLEPGARVITGVLTAEAAAAAPVSSPLIPFGRGRGGRR